MAHYTPFTALVAPLPVDDIDTDQIIPARFLKGTVKTGLGKHLFADWRYNPDGSPKPDFVLNRPGHEGAEILLAGNNFGCGSSREHAAWALRDFGFRAVISTSFADIFRNNALKNGVLPVELTPGAHAGILRLLAEDASVLLGVDLERQTVILPDSTTVGFPIDRFAKTCLLDGVDELGYLLRFEELISAYERKTR